MSGKIMGKVWDLDLPHNEMLVLLALADHADHEGNNVYPGLSLIAWKTGYSEQQVRRVMRHLEAVGILVAIERKSGKKTVYSIRLSAGKLKAERASTPDKKSPLTKSNPLHSGTPNSLHFEGSTPDIASAKSSQEPSLEPSLEPLSVSSADEKRKPEKKVTVPADKMNPMKDAIAAVFGWKWEQMTRVEAGIIQASARELCLAGVEPSQVPSLYGYCKKRFTTFKPRALSSNLSDWLKTTQTPANPPPTPTQPAYVIVDPDPEAVLRIRGAS